MTMKVTDIKPGYRFRLPGSDTVYEALSAPEPYHYGEGDVVIEVRWTGAMGEKTEKLAFKGRIPVQRVWGSGK